MPVIRPCEDIRNYYNEISDICHNSSDTVFITKNGTGDLAVMSIEEYEKREALIELYAKLAEAEQSIANGEGLVDFDVFAQKLKERVNG